MSTVRLVIVAIAMFTLETRAGTQEKLAAYRSQIDSVDQRIVQLLQQRARIVEEVRTTKQDAHLPVTVPSREQEVILKAQEFAKDGPLPAEAVGRIYEKIIEEMRDWESRHDTPPQ
jgi:chorismate mutase